MFSFIKNLNNQDNIIDTQTATKTDATDRENILIRNWKCDLNDIKWIKYGLNCET